MLGVNLEQKQVTTDVGRVLPVKTLSDLTEELKDEETFFEMGFGPVAPFSEFIFQRGTGKIT
jgi:hypothetical protein